MSNPRSKTPVATYDERSMSLRLNKKKLSQRFKDGTKISLFEITKVGEHTYFQRRGRDRAGNCHLWRARVEFGPDGAVYLIKGLPATGCIGDPCASCKFADTDGLSCACRKRGRCNHFITSGVRGSTSGVFKA